MSNLMAYHGRTVQMIMDILGLPKNVTEFTLDVGYGRDPVVKVTFYPDETPFTGVVTKRFELKEISQ